MEQGSKGGKAINSVIFADNNLSDQEVGGLLLALQSASSRVKSITSVRNGFGKQSLESLEKLFGPPGDETKTK